MKKIEAIGFDMDYTLIRYKTKDFEQITYEKSLEKLHSLKKYPEEVKKLSFDFKLSIQGLVIDKKRGMVLKISRYGKVKIARFGLELLDYKEQEKVYSNRIIDLKDKNIQSLDTSFLLQMEFFIHNLLNLKKMVSISPTMQQLQMIF